jgi:hypothetical protein
MACCPSAVQDLIHDPSAEHPADCGDKGPAVARQDNEKVSLFLTRADQRISQSGLWEINQHGTCGPTSPSELKRKTTLRRSLHSFGLTGSPKLGDSESLLAAPLTTARQITDNAKSARKERKCCRKRGGNSFNREALIPRET